MLAFKMIFYRNVIISRYVKQNKDGCIVHKTTFIMLNVRMFVIGFFGISK